MIDIKVEMSGGGAEVKLGGEATITGGEELKKALTGVLQTCQSVVVRTENTLDVDLSCLQILCAAHKTACRLNKDLSVENSAPGSFERAIHDLGYSRQTPCMDLPHGQCLFTGGSHE
jgi:hypothetical protein